MTPVLLEECYYRLVEGRLVGVEWRSPSQASKRAVGVSPRRRATFWLAASDFPLRIRTGTSMVRSGSAGDMGGGGTANHRRKDPRICAANANRD